MEEGTDVRGRRAVQRLCDAGAIRSACYLQQIHSTNSRALADVASGSVPDDFLPRLYVTDQQTAGRGRSGRAWISSEGTLTLSLVMNWNPTPSSANLASLAVGVGIARSVEYLFAPLQSRLKWPNDLYLAGGKAGGILCERNQSHPHHLVIGVGLNVGRLQQPNTVMQSGEDAEHSGKAAGRVNGPAESGFHATSIADCVGRQVQRYDVLENLVEGILAAIDELTADSKEILSDFRQRCWLSGQQVNATFLGQPVQGVCRGITDDGKLVIETASGTVQCGSGDATRVRRR